jgi:uncharacterized protein (TIGR02996 family)
MNQDEAFLHDICEHPDDDGPRLVYADWLDEHGDSPRAAFIRAQCALARMDPDDPRRPELLQRERDWLNDAGARRPKLPKLAGVTWGGSYRRGFVASATVRNLQTFRKHAAALFATTPVEDVTFHGLTPSTARTLAALPALARVRGLTVGPGAGADGLRAILLSPHLAKLARLDLSRQDAGTAVVPILEVATLPDLTTLHLSFGGFNLGGTGLGPAGTWALAEALHFPRLETLSLSGGAIGDGAVALAATRGLSNLTTLNLSHNGITDAGATALATSPYLSRLATLDLGGNQIGAAGTAALVGSRHLPALRWLQLSSNPFGPTQQAVAENWHAAQEVPPPGARPLVLQLLHNQINDDGAALLAQWPALARLVILDLGYNPLGNAGAAALAASPHLANLTRLTLYNDPVELAGLWALAASPHLGRLSMLGMSKNRSSYTLLGTPPAAPSEMPAWSGLTLDLARNSLGLEEARTLAAWPGLARVRTLLLAGNRIGAVGATALATSPHAAGITELDLEANAIGDEGAKALAASPHLAGLTRLNLRANDVGNAGAQAVASSAHLAGLTSLNLGSNPQLGHAGAKALVQSPHLARLTFLGLGMPRAFGEVMAEALRKRFGKALEL